MTVPPRETLLCDSHSGPMLVFAQDQVIGRSIATTGQFGSAAIDEVTAFLHARGVRPNRFIDIGANVGTHVLHALSSGHYERGVAVEADPDNFHLLQANA